MTCVLDPPYFQSWCIVNTTVNTTSEIQHPKHIFIAGNLEILCSSKLQQLCYNKKCSTKLLSMSIELKGLVETVAKSVFLTGNYCNLLIPSVLVFWDYFMYKQSTQ